MGIERPRRFRTRPRAFIQDHPFPRPNTGQRHRPDPEITINLEKLRDTLNSLEGFSE